MWGRIKQFYRDYQIYCVMIPVIGALHWSWQQLQYDRRYVQEHEVREFPPISLYKHAKHLAGLGPQPEKHSPGPPPESKSN